MTSDCTIVCLIRDEAPYLLEWIAWYKLIGADRLVFYDNDSQDGGSSLLRRLDVKGEVRYIPWPDIPETSPQFRAYSHAIAACETEWIGFFDADELLVLPRHKRLADFLAGFPGSCSAIGINQRVVGCNGQRDFAPGLVAERFPLGSNETLWFNLWIKTIARSSLIESPGIHAPSLQDGRFLNADGDDLVLEEGQRSKTVSHTTAYYNHYILKSVQEFLKKRARGPGSPTPEARARSEKYSDAFFKAHNVALFPDPTIEAFLPKLKAERARLAKLAE